MAAGEIPDGVRYYTINVEENLRKAELKKAAGEPRPSKKKLQPSRPLINLYRSLTGPAQKLNVPYWDEVALAQTRVFLSRQARRKTFMATGEFLNLLKHPFAWIMVCRTQVGWKDCGRDQFGNYCPGSEATRPRDIPHFARAVKRFALTTFDNQPDRQDFLNQIFTLRNPKRWDYAGKETWVKDFTQNPCYWDWEVLESCGNEADTAKFRTDFHNWCRRQKLGASEKTDLRDELLAQARQVLDEKCSLEPYNKKIPNIANNYKFGRHLVHFDSAGERVLGILFYNLNLIPAFTPETFHVRVGKDTQASVDFIINGKAIDLHPKTHHDDWEGRKTFDEATEHKRDKITRSEFNYGNLYVVAEPKHMFEVLQDPVFNRRFSREEFNLLLHQAENKAAVFDLEYNKLQQ